MSTFKPQELSGVESLIKYGLSTVIFPTAPLWFFTVPNNRRAVVTNFGKYRETLPEGLHWRSPIGLDCKNVFIGMKSHDLKTSRIVDSNGNPVDVSGTVNYRISEPEKFVVNINANEQFLNNQAEIVLKRVTSEYPYESKTGESLSKDGKLVSERMTSELQKLVDVAGITIDSFMLTNMCYAPEIAQSMLIRQRALAYIDAKDTIGKASAGIVQQIITDVESKCNVKLSDDRKGQIIDHLLVVMTSESGAQPMIPLGSSSGSGKD
jgi:regulator of protease activity HflC (stomatin/prohibitin superfamily)